MILRNVGETMTLHLNPRKYRVAKSKLLIVRKNKQTRASPRKSRKNNNNNRVSVPRNIPLAVVSSIRTNQPKIMNYKNKVIVVHREMFHTICGAATEDPVVHTINPGDADMFPWLSSIAPSYETYHFNKLLIEYQPSCSATTAGSIAMAIDYDISDAAPTSIASLLSMDGAVLGSLYSQHRISLKSGASDFVKKRFVTSGSINTVSSLMNTDRTAARTTDLGHFYMSTDNTTVATKFGYVFVSYEVEFNTPQQPEIVSGVVDADGTAVVSVNVPSAVRGSLPIVSTGTLGTFEFIKGGNFLINQNTTTATAPGCFQDPQLGQKLGELAPIINRIFTSDDTDAPTHSAASWLVNVAKGTTIRFPGMLANAGAGMAATLIQTMFSIAKSGIFSPLN